MDQATSLAIAASISVYVLHRRLATPYTSFIGPPVLLLLLRPAQTPWFQFLLAYGITLLALVSGYRGFGHPLNDYPGPLLARFTGLWRAGRLWRGESGRLARELHEKYGDYVRIAPDELSVRDSSAIPVVYGNPGWRKGDYYTMVPTILNSIPNLVYERDRKEHARRRKTWDKAFSRQALERYEAVVRTTGYSLCEAILGRSQKDGGRVDLRREMSYFTWTIMYKIGFGGHGYNLVEDGPSPLWESTFVALEEAMKSTSILGSAVWLASLLRNLPRPPTIGRFTKMSHDLHRRRLADRGMSGDVSEVLCSPMQQVGLSPSEKRKLEGEAEADSGVLVVAGADTTGSVLAWVWYYLLSEPGKVTYSELRKQIDAAFEEDHELGSSELVKRAPLLDSVINEVLRMRPPVAVGPLQREAPPGGAVIGVSGHFIPEGTKVTIPPIALSYDTRLFEEPDKFKPERWSNGDFNREGFVPFSYGPHGCVGKQMAMQEMRQVVALLMRRFDMALAPEFDNTSFLENAPKEFFTAFITEPISVIVQERKCR